MPAKSVEPVVAYLSREKGTKDELQRLADEAGRTVSAEARRAIEAYVRSHNDP